MFGVSCLSCVIYLTSGRLLIAAFCSLQDVLIKRTFLPATLKRIMNYRQTATHTVEIYMQTVLSAKEFVILSSNFCDSICKTGQPERIKECINVTSLPTVYWLDNKEAAIRSALTSCQHVPCQHKCIPVLAWAWWFVVLPLFFQIEMLFCWGWQKTEIGTNSGTYANEMYQYMKLFYRNAQLQ